MSSAGIGRIRPREAQSASSDITRDREIEQNVYVVGEESFAFQDMKVPLEDCDKEPRVYNNIGSVTQGLSKCQAFFPANHCGFFVLKLYRLFTQQFAVYIHSLNKILLI